MSTISALIAWTFFGLVAGLFARLVVPGRQSMGWIATIVLGIVGSFAGGFLTYLVRGGREIGEPSGMIMSVIGAIVVLVLYLSIEKRRTI